ncbi:MAG: N-6 DNA methylase, partial [Promethearchaeota archaeon]
MNTILDDDFTNCINLWINKFNEIEFNVDNFIKSKWIIKFVIKYIFIHFFILIIHDKNDFLDKTWRKIEEQETFFDNRSFLRKFFQEINSIFYKKHNIKLIELINEEKTIISELSLANSNINLLYETIKSFLGINKFKSSEKTIIPNLKNFDLRNYKQDILGEIYEEYLKNYRKERGIFYTPLPIVKFIINNTIVKKLNVSLKKIENEINNGEYLALENSLNEFLAVRILDPACGSGVFLIHVLRELIKFHEKLSSLLNHAQNILIASSKRFKVKELGELQQINFLKL